MIARRSPSVVMPRRPKRRAGPAANLRGRLLGLALVGGLLLGSGCQAEAPASRRIDASRTGLWISREEVRRLPMSGAAWEALVAQARLPADRPDLANQDDPSNVRVLARALYFARTGDSAAAREVEQACEQIQGTETRASALAVSRELMTYVIAADLIGLDGAARARFEHWLRSVSGRSFRGRTLAETHEQRPNNWGTHAGATRIAIAAYLGDAAELERAAHVFRGWTGERDGWQGFRFGADDWQPEAGRRFAVNPRGTLRAGHDLGGVLPDDQRRSGPFRWPPPKENYVYEALQGAVAQAVLLERLGFDAWSWGDRALLRAFEWLHREADYPATGDDTWLPHVINRAYGTTFPASVPARPGKAIGFSDWTHARAAASRNGSARDIDASLPFSASLRSRRTGAAFGRS